MTIKYTEDELRTAVKQSISVAGVMRLLGYKALAGGSRYYLKKKIERLEIDMSHFTGQAHSKGVPSHQRKSVDEVLVFEENLERRTNREQLLRCLDEIGRIYSCEICENDGTWQGQTIVLHIDHKDGNWSNNLRENLRFLCPNCHTQTKTFGNKKRI